LTVTLIRALLVEAAGRTFAVATTQVDGFRRLLDTTDLNMEQWAWALVPPIAFLLLWEIGKLAVRLIEARREENAPRGEPTTSGLQPAEVVGTPGAGA
jgi:hypothetical protein